MTGVTMMTDEREAVVELAKGQVVLEIGCYKGHVTRAMAAVAKKVICVDWFLGNDGEGPSFFPEFEENVKGVASKIEVYTMRSDNFLETMADIVLGQGIDLAVIDGGHDYQTVATDALFLRYVVPGGYAAFHDSGWASIAFAINDTVGKWEDWQFVRKVRTLKIFRRLES